MNKGPQIEIDVAASRKITDVGSQFKLPQLSEDERKQLSREAWLAQYGDVQRSEAWFEARAPDWANNPNSWWYKSVGREGGKSPLWMRREWHLPELDCPPGRDRHAQTLDERQQRPLWAERMNLGGSRQGPQSATVYGHRQEYKPTHKTDARSMYERYQPTFERVLNEELPDISDPADGRFWKAGLAQGISTNPYEKRLAISARRKPIVVGPRTASVVVDGETHTLATPFREIAWLHPHMEFTASSIEHPVYRHVNLRVQMTERSGVSGEQGMVEALGLVQEVFGAVGDAMEADMAVWPARHAAEEAKRIKQEEEERERQRERDVKMERWVAMMAREIPYDAQLEVELYGKKISKEFD